VAILAVDERCHRVGYVHRRDQECPQSGVELSDLLILVLPITLYEMTRIPTFPISQKAVPLYDAHLHLRGCWEDSLHTPQHVVAGRRSRFFQ
ncbi:hypothetical protein EGW08_019462, partial [Elysia chlorotica]